MRPAESSHFSTLSLPSDLFGVVVGRTLGFAGEVEIVVERMLKGGVPGGLDD